MGTDLTGECELLLVDVVRDDRGRQGPEDPYREMAQAAYADHHGGRAGDELGQRRLDRGYGVSPASVRGTFLTGSRSPSGTR